MIYEPNVMVPRTCPLCEYEFLPDDGHVRSPNPADATEALQGHDRRAHDGGLIWYLRSLGTG